MIVFYGDNFELNLTGTKITLIEENPLFYNYFVKNYSWPFSKKVDDETSKKLGFLDLENSANYKTKIYGKFLIDNSFDVAYLILTGYHNSILQGVIYYGEVVIKLLDKPLKDLPFPVVNTTLLKSHAKEVITKSYPEVNYNFPMVIDDNFSSNSKYEKFEGIINNYDNDNFVTNYNQTIDGETVVFNKNVMTPFPYLMGVLKAGFDSVNMIMQGSFVSDKVNEKLLLFTDKHLEKFYSGLPDGFQFTTTGEVWENGVVSADFVKYYTISQQGSYKVQLYLNIPPELKVIEYTVQHNTNVVFTSRSNTINEAIIINVKSAEDLGNFIFTLKLRKFTSNPSNAIGNIENYNNVDFSFSDGQLNIFPTSFSLSEMMPDMTFGKFLNKIKNWLNLEITFDNNLVSLNYIEDKFLDVEFKDERHLEIPKPYRTFNQNKLYKLVTSNTNLTIGSSGVVTTTEGFREEDITTIDMGLEIMPVQAKDAVFTTYKNEDTNDFKLFLYDGLQSGLPVAVDSVADRNYSLNEVYNRYWKNWLFFRLNSETYKDKFTAHFLEQFNKSMGRMKYNKKHLYKKIKKRRIDEINWEYEIESETLP